jgi:hypothetical protein
MNPKLIIIIIIIVVVTVCSLARYVLKHEAFLKIIRKFLLEQFINLLQNSVS